MILSAIAAMSKNRVIGKNNQLPWHIPEDLKFFREKTTSKVMIMGRKTFESFPGVLKNRYHIVISRDIMKAAEVIGKKTGAKVSMPEHKIIAEGSLFSVVSNFQAAVDWANQLVNKNSAHYNELFSEEVFVIGGGEIYQQSLDKLDKIYLTVIDKEVDGDVYFPEFKMSDFKLIDKSDRTGFSFNTFQKQAP
jgi:dihydrofolate reductase